MAECYYIVELCHFLIHLSMDIWFAFVFGYCKQCYSACLGAIVFEFLFSPLLLGMCLSNHIVAVFSPFRHTSTMFSIGFVTNISRQHYRRVPFPKLPTAPFTVSCLFIIAILTGVR